MKKKFKPVITRIKLNPEQAVLYCNCYAYGNRETSSSTSTLVGTCFDGAGSPKNMSTAVIQCRTGSAASS